MLRRIYKYLLHTYRFKHNSVYHYEYLKKKEYHSYLRSLGRKERQALGKICAVIRAYQQSPMATSRTIYRSPE